MLDKVAAAVKTGYLSAGERRLRSRRSGVRRHRDEPRRHARSLPSREVIADSVELAVSAHAFDAVVLIPTATRSSRGCSWPRRASTCPPSSSPAGPCSPVAARRAKRSTSTPSSPQWKGHERCHVRGGSARPRGARVPYVRELRRPLHRELHELPCRGDRHGAARQRDDSGVYSERIRPRSTRACA